jgi:PhnB protein
MAQKPKPKVAPIAPGFTAITPYLRVKGAKDAIAFYKTVFGAKTETVMDMGGQIGHAELTIDGAKLCLADEFPEMGIVGPKTIGKTSVTIMHYCRDADATAAKAVAHGAVVRMPVADQFWGSRMGTIEDPFGHVWMIQTQIEEVSEAEMQKRMSAMMAERAPKPAEKKSAAKKKSK